MADPSRIEQLSFMSGQYLMFSLGGGPNAMARTWGVYEVLKPFDTQTVEAFWAAEPAPPHIHGSPSPTLHFLLTQGYLRHAPLEDVVIGGYGEQVFRMWGEG